jgi:hypothetical protein
MIGCNPEPHASAPDKPAFNSVMGCEIFPLRLRELQARLSRKAKAQTCYVLEIIGSEMS